MKVRSTPSIVGRAKCRCSTVFKALGTATVSARTRSFPYDNGVLYGTTLEGGTPEGICDEGCGTLFAYDLALERQTVIHRFTAGNDGASPGPIVSDNATLYGATDLQAAGPDCGESHGCGTIYAIERLKTKRFSIVFTEARIGSSRERF